jgi:hypothetical protein
MQVRSWGARRPTCMHMHAHRCTWTHAHGCTLLLDMHDVHLIRLAKASAMRCRFLPRCFRVAAQLRLRILRLQQDPSHRWQSLSPPLTIPPAATRCSVWQTKVHVSERVLQGLAAPASQRRATKARKQCISSTHHFKQPSSMVLQGLPSGVQVPRGVTGAVA